MIATAQSSERVGMEMADISRQQLAWQKERTARTDAVAEQVVNQQLELGRKQAVLTDDYERHMKETFRPVEQAIARRAIEYNLPEEQERMAGRARAEVANQYDNQRAQLTRQFGAYGFDPNRFAYINSRLAGSQAADEAAAANQGREQARVTGHALQMDAANLGRNLPSAQATSAGVAINAGNAAVGNQLAADAGAVRGSAAAQNWYGGAINAMGTASQAWTGVQQAQLGGYATSLNAAVQMRGQNLSHIASVYGSTAEIIGAGIAASDRRLKTDVRRVGTLQSGIPLYEYTIFGRREVGVMADDVEKVFPQLVIEGPGGFKMVNYDGLR